MASRKFSNASIGLHPRTSITASTGTAGAAASAIRKNAAFMEALKVLNEDTMQTACELLLSTRDYEKESVEGPSDLEKLLELYGKCQKAAEVIQREAPDINSMPKPMLSIPANAPRTSGASHAFSSAARAQAKPVTNIGKMVGKVPTHRRTGRIMPPAASTTTSTNKRLFMHHQDSDSSLGSKESTSSQSAPLSKRAKLSSAQATGAGGHVGMPKTPPQKKTVVQLPPPSALNFLAKLNKDKVTSAKAPAKKEKRKEAPAHPSSEEESPDSNAEPSTPSDTAASSTSASTGGSVPSRTQPSRASRSKTSPPQTQQDPPTSPKRSQPTRTQPSRASRRGNH